MTSDENCLEQPKVLSPKRSAPVIYRLQIERFRGIKALSWRPKTRVNVILGGGDTGKTTILEAIGLLLSPTNSSVVLDSDYYERDTSLGFSIQAVVALPPTTGVNRQARPSWPWQWNGSEAVVPTVTGEGEEGNEPAYCIRVRGTEDLELVYELLQPDGTTEVLSVALRRAIGLVRLGGDDRNDRDLRLVQGSALDRLLSDKSLRSRLSRELTKNNVTNELTDGAKAALVALDAAFDSRGLPGGLSLSVLGTQGASIAALVGLTAKRDGVLLPLASWGAGTRRLASLAIAEQNQGDAPVALVDEIERGLEPYRQRTLLERLQTSTSQAFITTHSPAALSAASRSSIWYLDGFGSIGLLDGTKISRHLDTDPEAFLARLAVVAEGATEVGFVEFLLEMALGSPLREHGVHVTDGGGHENSLWLLQALASAGLQFGGFADDEDGKHPEAWGTLEARIGPLLFRWKQGCLEKNVIAALPLGEMETLIDDPEGRLTGERLRTLADRLGIGSEKSFAAISSAAGSGLRDLIIAAAIGTVPEGKEQERKAYKAHSQRWFKSREGGRELAAKGIRLGAWASLRPLLLPFCNAVRTNIHLAEVQDIVS